MSSSEGNVHHEKEDVALTAQDEHIPDHHFDIESRRIRSIRVARKMRFLTAMAATGGFLFGYDTGVISGAMLPIQRRFGLTPWQEEVVVSSTVMAAFVSSLFGGSLNRAFGRRVAILFAASVFSAGSLVLAMSWGYQSLMVGRIIVGIGIGVASLTTPIYLAEVAVPHRRGRLVTINALLVTLGQFIAGMIDGIFDEYFPLEGWRYMLGLAAVPSLTMLVGFMFLPESPRWLAMNGKRERSLEVLQSIRDSDQEALEEWEEIVNALPVDANAEYGSSEYGSYDGHGGDVTVEKADHRFHKQVIAMISDDPTRSALFLGCGLMALQQLSGINTVMYYAASIYQMSGFSGKPPPFSMDAIDCVAFLNSVYILASSRNNIRVVERVYGFCTSGWNCLKHLFCGTFGSSAAGTVVTIIRHALSCGTWCLFLPRSDALGSCHKDARNYL